MRFNYQCPECGEYKWCGRECDHKPGHVNPIVSKHVIERRLNAREKHSAYMKEWWKKKREAAR